MDNKHFSEPSLINFFSLMYYIMIVFYQGYMLILCDSIKTSTSPFLITLLVLHIPTIYRTNTSETNEIRHTIQVYFISSTFPCIFLLLVFKTPVKYSRIMCTHERIFSHVRQTHLTDILL